MFWTIWSHFETRVGPPKNHFFTLFGTKTLFWEVSKSGHISPPAGTQTTQKGSKLSKNIVILCFDPIWIHLGLIRDI